MFLAGTVGDLPAVGGGIVADAIAKEVVVDLRARRNNRCPRRTVRWARRAGNRRSGSRRAASTRASMTMGWGRPWPWGMVRSWPTNFCQPSSSPSALPPRASRTAAASIRSPPSRMTWVGLELADGGLARSRAEQARRERRYRALRFRSSGRSGRDGGCGPGSGRRRPASGGRSADRSASGGRGGRRFRKRTRGDCRRSSRRVRPAAA